MSKKKKNEPRPQVWWMCFNPYSQTAPMVRHERFAEAQAEAMRLSQHERTKVHVLQLVGTAHPPQQVAIWEWRADQ
jgi:predicted acetyltransferase